MPTGVVNLGSDLERRAWMREGILQAKSKSFFTPLTGTTKDSIVFQSNNENAESGHTVIFDFDGNIAGRAIKGKDTAFGQGVDKKKFSDKITVERYRLVVNNGDKFDGKNIGDLNINEHSDSRNRLADLFIRWKDQSIFDAAQGNLGQAPTHTIDLGNSHSFNDLLNIMKILKTSNGFTTGDIRRPLDPFRVEDGRPMWLYVMDTAMANLLKSDTAGYQTIMKDGDIRGNDNRNIKGVIGKIGNLIIVEAEQFFGETTGTVTDWELDASSIEISGLRQYDGADPTTAAWTGQTGFNLASVDLHSRGLILGAGAVQTAFGKHPDYKFKESQDFGITSESAVEFWYDAKKTNMKTENVDDYAAAKVAGIDYGVIAVDVEVQ